jgi:hypothetical protein
LTLEELKGIAAEAGIDPRRVEQAAQTLARPRQSVFRIFLGTDSRIHVRSELETGADDRTLSEVLQEVRASTSLQGLSHTLPGGTEWTASNEWGTQSVSVSTTRDGTSLDVRGNFDNAARAAAGGAAALTGLGVVVMVAAVASVGPVAWALAPAVAAGALGIPRLLAGSYVRNEGERLQRLSERLRALLGKSAESDPDDTG